MGAQVAGRLDRDPGSPAGEHPGGDAGEQPAGQPDRGDRGQLRDLGLGGIQADIARIGPDGREDLPAISPITRIGAGIVTGRGNQLHHPLLDVRRDLAADQRHEGIVGPLQRRADDPADPGPGRRLDLLPPALPEQFLADPVGALFLTAHVLGQPRRQVLGVGDAALPESGHPADLGAVPLDLPPVPVIQADIGGGHADLPGDELDHVVRKLTAAPREPRLPQQELQAEAESQPGGTALVPQQPGLIGVQREMLDELLQLQRVRHARLLHRRRQRPAAGLPLKSAESGRRRHICSPGNTPILDACGQSCPRNRRSAATHRQSGTSRHPGRLLHDPGNRDAEAGLPMLSAIPVPGSRPIPPLRQRWCPDVGCPGARDYLDRQFRGNYGQGEVGQGVRQGEHQGDREGLPLQDARPGGVPSRKPSP